MQVGSFLELHTAVLAWHLYGQLWSLLLASGLAYLPFVALLAANLLRARRLQRQDTGVLALRWSEVDVYTAFVVLLAAVYPIVAVDTQQLSYLRNSCGGDVGSAQRQLQVFRLGDSDTSYDSGADAELIGAMQPRVPVWWLLLNNVVRGVAAVGISGLPCRADVRLLSAQLEVQRVSDPALRGELHRFHRDCWQPAAAEFLRRRPQVPEALRDNIEADISWAGSHFYRSTPGYYDYYHPREALPSFPYVASRDAARAAAKYAPQGGWPNCRQWWEDARYGLRVRLLAQVDADVLRGVRLWADTALGESSALAEQRVLRAMLDARRYLGAEVRPGAAAPPAWEGGAPWLRARLAHIGIPLESPTYQLRTMLARQAAPVAQALLLLLLIVLLPVLLAVSGYSLRGVLSMSFVMASIFFWDFLFALARWVDNHFLSAMLRAHAGGGARPDATLEALLLYVGAALFLLLPLLCTVLFFYLGVRTGRGLEGFLAGAQMHPSRRGEN